MSSIPALLFALTVATTPSPAQTVSTPATETANPGPDRPVPVIEKAPAKEEVLVLSPFEVVANTKGYFSSNTMSGTRLNSKIEDMGQSITVMTKEQMTDFAMLDINDVFDYMAGTEGTSSYSDFVLDRTGAVTDNVSLDPNNANRVRGIGKANIAFNNIQTTGRVPVDPLWLDSIELSRGPNANIFGLGEAAGTVNQVPATANTTRDFARTEIRGDSYGGWRGSLDVNRILMKNKLAVRASIAHQHTGFERKPSGEDARRLSFQLKAQPFKNTTVALSWFGYNNHGTRPNYTMPRDNITPWIAAGRPSWNTVTRLITLNGVTYGQGMVAGSTTPITTLPAYFSTGVSDGRSLIRIGNGTEAPYLTIPIVTNAATPAAGGVNNNIRYIATGPAASYGISQPLFASYAALRDDKSLYDYSSVNLQSANRQWDDVDTYLAQLDQIILNTTRHTLAAQVTFMREDAAQIQDMPLGPASVNGVIGELYADPNINNLDGTPNPYYGRPYLRSKEPYLRDNPMLWDTTRAQLAYKLDFTQNAGWSKWLGSHQLLGYYEYKDQQNRNYAWRNTAKAGSAQWLADQFAAGIPAANRTTGGNTYPSSHNHLRLYEFYYVGDTPGGGVEYGPSLFPQGGTVPFVWGNTGNFRADPVTVGYTPAPDGSGGGRQTIVKTTGGVVQSSFLDGRLITTFGLREDKVNDRNKVTAVLTPDLLGFDYEASGQWQDSSTWRLAQGKTKSMQVVAIPFRDVKFLNNMVSNGRGIGRLFGEAATGLRLTYNKSDNFIPQGPAVDVMLNTLPNQTGHAKEYGLWLTLLDGRLSIRYNHHTSLEKDKRNGDINTIAQRTLRHDGILNTNNHDRHNLQDRAGDPTTGWIAQLNPTWTTAQIRAETERVMGLTYEFMDAMEAAGDAGRIAAPNDVLSKGDELEINFNPTRAWTVSASVTKNVSINQNAGIVIEEWLNARLPIWNAIEDPRFTPADDPRAGTANAIPTGATGHLLWRYISGAPFNNAIYGYDTTNSAAANYATFIEGPVAVFRQLEGKPRPQTSKYVVKVNTKYNLSGLTDNRYLKNMSVGGSLRWNDKKSIGFLGQGYDPATFPTVTILALDTTKPVYTPAETYVDVFASYNTKLFRDKVRARFQFNVKNVTESGDRLLTTAVFPDGTALAYRIIDPRQFILSATFDF